MRFASAAIALASAILGTAQAADAAVIYSQTFDASGFRGNFLQTDNTDRFGTSDLYYAADFAGWTFTNGYAGSFPFPLIAVDAADAGNGSIWLQEIGTSASYTLTGLVAGRTYALSTLLSGDNIPGGNYSYLITVDGGTVLSGGGVSGTPGSNPLGTTLTGSFTAAGSSAVIRFADATLSGGANAVFDNITITGAVPEASTWVMLVAGFGLVGVASRRRKAIVAA